MKTLRHRVYGDGRVTIFLLDIPPGNAAVVHTRKSGEIELVAAGPAMPWTNAGNPAHLVVVTVR